MSLGTYHFKRTAVPQVLLLKTTLSQWVPRPKDVESPGSCTCQILWLHLWVGVLVQLPHGYPHSAIYITSLIPMRGKEVCSVYVPGNKSGSSHTAGQLLPSLSWLPPAQR